MIDAGGQGGHPDRGPAVAGALRRARPSWSSTAATPWWTTTLKRAFAEDIVFLRMVRLKPVVVHGGGPQISSMLHGWASPASSAAACG